MWEVLDRFNHVGIAVWDTDKALGLYRDVLGGKVTTYKEMGTTNDCVFSQFFLGGQRIELIEPLGQKESFLTRFLDKWGEGLHHLTFQVRDVRKTTAYLKSKGLRITDEFFEDPLWKTAFISPTSASGVLLQLFETPSGSVHDYK